MYSRDRNSPLQATDTAKKELLRSCREEWREAWDGEF
jgi:hypothetical protein